jgi:lipopolysaccharide/colanic/teichoic acid biosynthesis glycosyltransferase
MSASAYPSEVVRNSSNQYSKYATKFNLLDRTIALVALIALAPLLILTAVCIAIFDPGPIFFSHRRIGYKGQTFGCLKFRSMVVDADRRLAELLERDPRARLEWHLDHKLRNDPRITPFGKFLRKSSIDELPQLFNVLRGEMRIVGPRPIVAGEIEKYGRFFQHYTSVVPGLTGLWQVTGRNDVSYRRRIATDVFYVRNRTLWLDFKIMLATVGTVLTAKGTF